MRPPSEMRRPPDSATRSATGSAPAPGPATGPASWDEFRALAPAPPGVRKPWGEGPRGYGELRLPGGSGPHPVAVVVHGGCWSSMADLHYMSHLAEALTDGGWATWSLAFRRVGDEGGGWPGTMADAGRGLDHLRELARDHPLDLERVVTVGHSSGGHLALWLAARPSLPDTGVDAPARMTDRATLRGERPLPVAGGIGLAPIADLIDFHLRTDRGCPATAVAELLGGDPTARMDRVALADPARLAPLGVPQLLVTGSLDRTVPTAHARVYADRVSAAGDDVTLVEVEGAGHFEVVAPWHATWTGRTGPAIREFLARVR